MKTVGAGRPNAQFLLLLSLPLLSLLLFATPSGATPATMNDYCVVPAFIGENVPANLLLMIDNSSSMYDLSYSDQGLTGHCATTTTKSCQSSADCPIVSGTTHESCTGGRAPYYCIDETYKTNVCSGTTTPCGADSDCNTAAGQTCTNLYAGYYNSTTYYSYDLDNKYFQPSTYDSSQCTKGRTNEFCVGISGSNTVNYFGASGNYLNWLMSSKFDVEKRILTGGKVVSKMCTDTDRACNTTNPDCTTGTCDDVATKFVQSESRGCLGQGFAKISLDSDFTNYSGSTDPNKAHQTGIVFLIKGPKDSDNPSAPSRGGQTYIEIYNGAAGGTSLNMEACQHAIDAWAADNKQAMSDYSATCIGYNTSVSSPNFCYGLSSRSCPNNLPADCVVHTDARLGTCDPGGQSCSSNTTCGTTHVQGDCDNQVKKCDTDQDCTVVSSMGTCDNQTPAKSCTQSSQCTIPGTNGTCSAGTRINLSCTSSSNCPTPVVYGTCSNKPSSTCTGNANCNTAEVLGTCQYGGTACRANGDCAGYCTGNTNKSCTPIGSACPGTNGDCVSDTCTGYVAPTGTCTGYTPAGTAACNGYVAPVTGNCVGYAAGSTGTCHNASTTQNQCVGAVPASDIDYGPCVNPNQSLVVKTKTAYTHTINTCSQYLDPSNGSLSSGDVTNFENGGDCVAVYSAGVCSNAPTQGCAKNSDCGAGTCISGPGVCLGVGDNNKPCAQNSDCTNGVCTKGPRAILPGNAALVCSQSYLGAYYTGSGPTWGKNDWSPDMDGQIDAFKRYCSAAQPTVIDPTSAVAGTGNTYMQTPAMLGGMGVEGQLGKAIGTLPVRLKVPAPACASNDSCTGGNICSNGHCIPGGLVQQFGGRIRIGAMSFNFNGSASEAAATTSSSYTGIVTPLCCVNDTTKLCATAADCGNNTCSSCTNNLDGGQVIHPVGLGTCAVLTTTHCSSTNPCADSSPCLNGFCGTRNATACATNASCGTGEVCVSLGVGDHDTGLVNTLDRIRANAWTPFAEAFYNVIGYYAVQKTCDNSSTACKVDGDCGGGHCSVSTGRSRTDLRVNSGDYDATLNPSQYPCQQNYLMLITDGSSTADRNPNVKGLATGNASLSSTPVGTCSYFAGSSYLPTLSWLGRHMNISALPAPSGSPPAATAASVVATQGRDAVTTYVVSTGGSNGLTGECNSLQLLSDTASNGGSVLKQANNPQDLYNTLEKVFEELAAKSASGTAASILSNSEGSGANILQAIFFPRKVFEGQTEAYWLGELNNLWYFVDPFIGNSSTREDTTHDNRLKLMQDYVLQFGFDNVKGETTVKILKDSNGDGTGDTNPTECVGTDPRCVINPYPTLDGDPNAVYLNSPDNIVSLWKAGKQLWQRDLTDTGTPRRANSFGGARTIYSISGGNMVPFSYDPDSSALFATNLQYPGDSVSAKKLMKYVHGFDYPDDPDTWRSRTVKIGDLPGPTVSTSPSSQYYINPKTTGIGVWKLGDIISSTPRVQSTLRQNGYNLAAPSGYNDTSYGDALATTGYIGTSNYKSRGMVYVGGNDGMLHAFRLGILNVAASGEQKATLSNNTATVSGTGLGNEAWAFIPQNALPYLKYYAEKNYSHLYFLDGNNTVVDASVGKPAGCGGDYWDCVKDTTTGNGTNWRSILVGGMGIGGASRNANDGCGTGNGGTCVKTPIDGVGYSSYYALDVTRPDEPQFLWEFSDAAMSAAADRGLGFATSGPAIVKINAPGDTHHAKNGRWFAVFASGPTGPIDTDGHRFMGTSSQPLKVYVVDLNATLPFVNGTNYWVLTDVYTGTTSLSSTVADATHAPLNYAFAGSLVNGSIDVDRWNPSVAGNYQDDAVYFGYSQSAASDGTGPWTKGGILKIVTGEDPNPGNWKIVKVMDTPGPVTTGISRLQDRKNHKLWLYFGTGRYYYLQDDFNPGSRERLYGIQDLCYRDGISRSGTSHAPVDSLDAGCATLIDNSNSCADHCVIDQSTASHATLSSGDAGWYIPLDAAHTSDPEPSKILGAERSITDPVAMTNGAVFFPTYKPNNDFCQFGGVSYMWAVKYDTGTQAPAPSLQGKALVQVSTGQFKEIDLSTAFTDKYYRRMGDQNAMTGKPPSDSPPIVSKSNNKPVRRILHMQER